LTDSDESAFRQIPRRRSNSEATHHYQSVNDSNHHMTHRNTIDNSRPLLMAERCRSVNKAYNFDNRVDFRRSNPSIDKKVLQNDSNNPNNIYSNRKISENTNNYMETKAQQKSSTKQKSEPIHMTLEEVRNIFSKNHSKRCKNAFFMPKSFSDKCKRSSNELNDAHLCKSKSKSKIKCAFENLFRTKRKSDSPVPSPDQNIVQSEPPTKNSTFNSNESHNNLHINCANESSTSPFTHRALPPLPNNVQDFQSDSPNREDDEYERQKFLDYAASIERVKDVRIIHLSFIFSFEFC